MCVVPNKAQVGALLIHKAFITHASDNACASKT